MPQCACQCRERARVTHRHLVPKRSLRRRGARHGTTHPLRQHRSSDVHTHVPTLHRLRQRRGRRKGAGDVASFRSLTSQSSSLQQPQGQVPTRAAAPSAPTRVPHTGTTARHSVSRSSGVADGMGVLPARAAPACCRTEYCATLGWACGSIGAASVESWESVESSRVATGGGRPLCVAACICRARSCTPVPQSTGAEKGRAKQLPRGITPNHHRSPPSARHPQRLCQLQKHSHTCRHAANDIKSSSACSRRASSRSASTSSTAAMLGRYSTV